MAPTLMSAPEVTCAANNAGSVTVRTDSDSHSSSDVSVTELLNQIGRQSDRVQIYLLLKKTNKKKYIEQWGFDRELESRK